MAYDDAVAAYAEFMSNEGSEEIDPTIEKKKKAKEAADKKAKEELENLTSNDATSAFAGLIEA